MSIFKLDLKRAIISKSMLMSILLGLLAIALGIYFVPVSSAIQLHYSNATDITEIEKIHLIKNSFNKVTLWHFGNYFYPFIMPLIACIPFTITYMNDKKSGFNRYIIIRGNYKDYIFSKVITNFISGFLSIFIINMLAYIVIFFMDSGSDYRSLFYENIFLENLSNNNFDLFIVIYTIICSIMGGAYSLVGLAISSFTNNKLIGLISPFVIYYLGSYIISSININFSPMIVNKFNEIPGELGVPIIIQLSVLLISSILVFLYKTYWGEEFE